MGQFEWWMCWERKIRRGDNNKNKKNLGRNTVRNGLHSEIYWSESIT